MHKHNPTSVPTERLDAARTALNLALNAIAEKILRWSGARYYQTGSLLAARLTPKIRTHTLPKIKLGSGTLSQNPPKNLEIVS